MDLNYISILAIEISKNIINIGIYVSLLIISGIYLLLLIYKYMHNNMLKNIEHHKKTMNTEDYEFWKMNKIAINTFHRRNIVYPYDGSNMSFINDIENGILQNS